MEEIVNKLDELKDCYEKLMRVGTPDKYKTITDSYNAIIQDVEPKIHIHKVIPNVKISNMENHLVNMCTLIDTIRKQLYAPRVFKNMAEAKSSYRWYDFILVQIIKNTLHTLNKRPLPAPPHFDSEAYNAFITNDLHKFTNILKAPDVELTTENLIKMINDLDAKKISFLKEPYKSKVLYTKRILDRWGHKLFGHDKALISVLKSKLDSLDMNEDDLQEIINQYEYIMGSEAVKIDDKDISVLLTAMKHCPTRELYEDLCKAIQIPEEYREVLFKNLMNQIQPPQIDKLQVSSQFRHLFL